MQFSGGWLGQHWLGKRKRFTGTTKSGLSRLCAMLRHFARIVMVATSPHSTRSFYLLMGIQARSSLRKGTHMPCNTGRMKFQGGRQATPRRSPSARLGGTKCDFTRPHRKYCNTLRNAIKRKAFPPTRTAVKEKGT